MSNDSVLYTLFFFTASLLVSCTSQNDIQRDAQASLTIPPPGITTIADLPDSLKPKVILLDTMPAPISRVINIPPSTKSYVDPVNGFAIAPEAQGKSVFKNYTTDDGLPLDGVLRALKDHSGNLWFATNGGLNDKMDAAISKLKKTF